MRMASGGKASLDLGPVNEADRANVGQEVGAEEFNDL